MSKQLKAWDAYVAEAAVAPVELPLSDGTVLTIHQPSYGAILALNAARASGDVDAQLTHLCGEDNAARLRELFAAAPIGAVQAFLRDVTAGLGLSEDPGEASASPS
ncbi:hypothetical protein GCM10010174_61450 [Kutzneria viridogrisea]|uniref:Uncharacterized protein n=1 Tax=Kutzneria viridogrisea TaxID=47990 RepID=A0ABR6BGX2_9PSEU|nr:hypothetical protein [Kutzneria viridogrisea]